MTVDLELKKSHGFYELLPLTDAGRAFVAEKRFKELLSFDGRAILLDSFFANAGDFVRCNALNGELTVKWGDSFYHGLEGQQALWEECA